MELHFVYCHWHDLLFEICKTSEVMQTSSVSLEVVETEIKATVEVLKKYRNNGYNNTVPCAREIAEALQINCGFAESRPRKKEECLNRKQRTRVVKCHKKTNLQQIFCH